MKKKKQLNQTPLTIGIVAYIVIHEHYIVGCCGVEEHSNDEGVDNRK